MAQDYTFWENALRGVAQPVHDGVLHAGFYRMKSRNRRGFSPVRIWKGIDGKWNAMQWTEIVKFPDDIWTFCCRNPISREEYRDVMNGKPWRSQSTIAETVAQTGHNNPPKDDPFRFLEMSEIVREAVAQAIELSEAEIDGKDLADTFQNTRADLLKIGKELENLRSLERSPIEKTLAEINGRWASLIGENNAAHLIIRDKLAAWLKKEDERQRLDREAAKALGADLPQDAPVRVGTGRATSLKTRWRAEITDWSKAIEHFSGHDKVRDLIAQLANAEARASHKDGPGFKAVEDKGF